MVSVPTTLPASASFFWSAFASSSGKPTSLQPWQLMINTLPAQREVMVSSDFSLVISISFSPPYFFFSRGMTRPLAALIFDTRGILDEQMYSQHLQEKQSMMLRDKSFSAVSYTHLDVYKRQAPAHRPARA